MVRGYQKRLVRSKNWLRSKPSPILLGVINSRLHLGVITRAVSPPKLPQIGSFGETSCELRRGIWLFCWFRKRAVDIPGGPAWDVHPNWGALGACIAEFDIHHNTIPPSSLAFLTGKRASVENIVYCVSSVSRFFVLLFRKWK